MVAALCCIFFCFRVIRGNLLNDTAGQTIDLAVVCDSRAPMFAQQRVSADLATTPFKARFLDTTTAANLRECTI